MNVRFKWTAECQESFQELKELICASTVAVHWDPNKKTRLYVDRGPEGLGGTVAQDHGKLGEKSCWGPVHYSKVDGEDGWGEPWGGQHYTGQQST